jgi:CRP-like cAMP-binding protein
MAGLKWELQRLPLFASFDERALDAILKVGTTKVYRAKSVLFHEGDPGGSMVVVLSGKVKVSAFSTGGRECVLSFVGPGEVLGEITLLDGGARTATCTALEDTRVFALSRKDFLPVLETNLVAAMHIIELLCERLRNTSRLVEDTAFLAAGPRLARALLRLVAAHGVKENGFWRIDMKLPQSTLGAYVGLMRESVNRQLRAWQEDGVINSTDEGITVMRRDVLEEIAEAG